VRSSWVCTFYWVENDPIPQWLTLLLPDPFCLRQFDDPKYHGAQIKYDKTAFEAKINEIFRERNGELVDGCVAAARVSQRVG
jgi:hypothetical protein